MKKLISVRKISQSIMTFLLVAVCIFFIAMTVSCSFFFLENNFKIEGRIAGSLTVRVLQASSPGEKSAASARTLVPSFSAKSFVITCLKGGSVVAIKTLTSPDYTFTDLSPGEYTVEVQAYNHETTQTQGTLIATGSSPITLTPNTSPSVTVPLSYIQNSGSGTGSISYTLEWPTSSADSLRWKLGGEDWVSVGSLSPLDTKYTYTITISSIASGSYPLIIEFSNGTEVAGYGFEMVNVYDNLESSRVVTSNGTLADKRIFTAAEIQSSGSGLAVLVEANDNSDLIKLNDSTRTGIFITESATTNIIVTPMAGTPGLKIEYTWNESGTYTTATAGTPIALTLDGNRNTLLFSITPPNSATSKEYAITVVKPIVVMNENDLLLALQHLDSYIILGKSIVVEETWGSVGTSIAPFVGTFDGNGFEITNLSVLAPSGDVGFFGYVRAPARISNVRLLNVNIAGSPSGDNNDGVGGLVGQNYGGTITNCSVSGTVSGASRVGGLVGKNRAGGIISECYSTATVSVSATSQWVYAGGLVGSNCGDIINCYARGAVSLSSIHEIDAIGGLVGSMENNDDGTGGTVTNCYASNTVSTSAPKGGLIGVLTSPATCISSYYNTNLSGCSDTGKGTLLTTAAIKTQSNFSGWNFSDTWVLDLDINSGYPYLKDIPPAVIVITETTMAATAFQTLINSDLSADYKLDPSSGTTLTLTDGPLTPIGSASNPFTGTFDGGDKNIKDLNVNATGIISRAMFSYVGVGGVVKNLHLENVSISNSEQITGSIAGTNSGTIYLCSSSGTLSGPTVGGLVGVNNGIISECWSNATITSSSFAGGLVYQNAASGHIVNCYARGVVSTASGGGLVATNSGSINNCYAAGPITTTGTSPTLQCLVGANTGTITNCFFDESKIDKSYAVTVITDPTNYFGIPKNGIEMRTESTFTTSPSDWNFTTDTTGVWAITRGINGGYPYLQKVTSTIDTPIATPAAITNLAGDYRLNDHVTLSGDFTPLGTFTGSFDGNGKTISNMKIELSDGITPNLGMFETIAKAGFVRGVHFEDSDVLTRTRNTVGTLAGQNDGTVYECTSRGAVFGGDNTGGLIGLNNGLIQACSARGKVQGNNDVGGLVGLNKGSITESFAFSGVFGNQRAGGLVGTCESVSDPAIRNCYSRGVVSSPAIVGGFVGQASDGKIQDCYSATGVSLINSDPYAGNNNAGAFVGNVLVAATDFINCKYDTGRCGLNSNGESASPISGILGSVGIGNMAGFKWLVDANKNGGYPYLVALTPNDDIIISNEAELRTISNTSADYYLMNDITLTRSEPVKVAEIFNTLFTNYLEPFTGTFDGGGHTIENISGGTEINNVGMLFKYMGGAALVQNVILINAISNNLNNQRAGLLCSQNKGTLYRCATSGEITNSATETGGLIGLNQGLVVECYSTAAVKDLGWTGGLIGLDSGGTIINSYARGSVRTTNNIQGNADVGGLVGNSTSSTNIINSYSTGAVSSDNVTAGWPIGGLTGQKHPVTNCFYDKETSKQTDSYSGVTSASTFAMKRFNLFTGVWNIATPPTTANTWGIGDPSINDGYPYLQWAGANTMLP